jgi:hypothetical protein
MVNEENSDLASVTTDDSEPAVVSTLIQSVNVDKFRYHKGTPVEFATGPDEDQITCWMREANPWKPLRQQALDLLSIPAMSAEAERVSSSAKQTQIANNTINYNGLPN